MAKFFSALDMVLAHEGSTYVDDTADSGGASKFGISLRFYRSKIQADANAEAIKSLSIIEASDIYDKYWWQRAPFAEINDQKLCNRVFDLAVNMGSSSAIKCLQQAVNACVAVHLVLDGMLGQKTIAEVNKLDALTIYNALIDAATIHYQAIVANNPKDAAFLNGWLNRLKT